MSAAALPNPPPSPGFAARRKAGGKTHPQLPLSAFSPPNSGTSEKFPLPPSPSTVHPDAVVDAHVVGTDLSAWKAEAGDILGGRTGGVVLSLAGKESAEVESVLSGLTSETPILSVLVPFSLDSASPITLPSATVPIGLTAVFAKATPESLPSLRSALELSRVVDLDVQGDITADQPLWDSFEDLLTKATADLPKPTPLVLSHILPPPHDITLPIIQLISHPSYRKFQEQIATLSLFPNVYAKFLPPTWGDAPASGDKGEIAGKEWKRRIKMYIGPVLEAFGYQRIIFGSAPSSASTTKSVAGEWYELARESFAELGVEQEMIDAVFAGNARKVYGSA